MAIGVLRGGFLWSEKFFTHRWHTRRVAYPCAVSGALMVMLHDKAFAGHGALFRFDVAARRLQVLKRSSGTSYSRDNMGSLSIRDNEENLTYLWSSSMVENSYRFLGISKMDWRNVSGLVDGRNWVL
ncbi:hypothetical protein YC2023_109495 [Brassica napus]